MMRIESRPPPNRRKDSPSAGLLKFYGCSLLGLQLADGIGDASEHLQFRLVREARTLLHQLHHPVLWIPEFAAFLSA
jgi:hypothetical protein